MIDGGGVDADHFDFLFDQPLRGSGRKPGRIAKIIPCYRRICGASRY